MVEKVGIEFISFLLWSIGGCCLASTVLKTVFRPNKAKRPLNSDILLQFSYEKEL